MTGRVRCGGADPELEARAGTTRAAQDGEPNLTHAV
jgi:hypothetical protein